MDPLIIGSLIGAGASLIGGFMGNSTTQSANQANVAMSQEMNEANLAHAEKWNQINHEMAREAQDAQLAHQQWARDQYVETTDYNRALQQEIFNREDTALQRAVSDATSAGFSPLAALGVPSGAGQVVGGSSMPGSMVSNNQVAAQSANQVAPQVQAVSGLSNSLSSIGSMVATMAENMSMQRHQREMQSADILAQYKRLGMDKVYEWLLQDDQQKFLNDQRIASHLDNLSMIAETAKFDATLEELRGLIQGRLQDDQQAHEADMQASQQAFEADYRVKTASAAYEDMLALGKEVLLPVIREFSPDLADWLDKDTFGEDLLVQIVKGVESTAPLIDSVSGAIEHTSDAAWSLNPLSKLKIFGGPKPKR